MSIEVETFEDRLAKIAETNQLIRSQAEDLQNRMHAVHEQLDHMHRVTQALAGPCWRTVQ
jgi:prefoldin subunit 5